MGPSFQGMPEQFDFHEFAKMFFLTVFLERKSGITGVPFGRTDISIGAISTTFHALLHRHGPVGSSFQGMPEEFDFQKCSFHGFSGT